VTAPSNTLDLPKQFLITRENLGVRPNWSMKKLGEYNLYLANGIGMTKVSLDGEKPTTEIYILGWFSHGSEFFAASRSGHIRTNETLEQFLFTLTGRFVVIELTESSLRCTCDAGAQFPAVYRPETGEVGSSPLVLGWTESLRRTNQIESIFTRRDGCTWYPFGETPFAGIRRLLPSQTVRLSGGAALLEDARPATGITAGIEDIFEHASGFVNSLAQNQQLMQCHLTAGWDSRMVLAATWPLRESVSYLTYLPGGRTAKIDSEVAGKIARRFGLNHNVEPVVAPNEQEVDQWLERTSWCIRDSVMALTRTVSETYANNFGLSGVGGEVGRAFYWDANDIGQFELTPQDLLQRLGFELSSAALLRAEDWLQQLEGQPRTRILDQAYIDLRLGCWAGPAMLGHSVEKPTLSPFNSALIYQGMISLPEDYRVSGRFARDFVALASDTLSRIPVNRLSGMSRLGNLPHEVARKLPKGLKSRLRHFLQSAKGTFATIN